MNKQSPSIAKITRPVQRNVVRRNNLFDLIDKFRSGSAIWISGPAGAGKTTFVSDYLSSNKLSNIWYHVDEGDSDPTTFFHYMGLAGKKAAPKRKNPLPHLTPEYMMGLPTFTRRFFEELYGRLKPPFCIVLDNIGNLAESSPLHDLLSIALAEVPDGGCIILISRKEAPVQYSRLKANGIMEVIGQNDLLLSPDESSELIKLRGDNFDKETVLALHERSEGWAAGFVLLVEHFKNNGMDSIRSDTSSHEELFNYFTSTIFNKIDSKTQDFIIKTALFPSITKRMAGKLAGNATGEQTFSKLTRNNYFISRSAGRESVYQYHDLFREFLLARLTKHFSASHIIELKQLAGSILDEAGYSEDAAALYIEAGDWESLSGLIQRNAQSFLMQGRSRLLEGLVRSLPQEEVDGNPWLLYWLGTVHMPMNIAEARPCFERAFKLFSKSKDPMGIYLSWSGTVMSIFYAFNNYKEFDGWVKTLDRLEKSCPFPSAEAGASVIRGMLYYLIFRNPGHPDADKWIERGLSLLRGKGPLSLRVEIAYLVIFHCVTVGEPARAENLIEEIKEASGSPEITPFAMITVKLSDAWYNWTRAFVGASLKSIMDGLAIAEESGVYILNYNLLGSGAASTLATGNLEGAQGFLDKLSSVLSSGNPLDISFYRILSGWYSLLKGDLPKAYRQLTDSKKIVEGTGMPFAVALNHFGTSLVLFERGEKRKAYDQLAKTRRIGRGMKNHVIEYMCLLCDARFALEDGAESVGLKALKDALVLAKTYGLAYYYFFQPDVMARLYVRALDEGIEVEYVQKMINQCNLIPDPPPTECERWPWPIKIFAMGRFSLLKDGSPVRSGRKAQQKPRDLLKALLAFGGRDVSEKRLVDALWPEADGDAGRQALSTTIHRLRHLLGFEKAITRFEGCISIDPRYCWVDVWAFERALGNAKELAKNDIDGALRLAMRIAGMYKGDFLAEEIDEPWAILFRERLKNKFLRHMERFGRVLERRGEHEKAVQCYRKSIEADPMAEMLCQRLMLCLKTLGRNAEAITVYKSLETVLSNNLQIKPSPRSIEILKEIKP